MKFHNYRHMIPVQIRFSDVDMLRHVNNACYHTYIELGRVSYFRQVLGKHVNWQTEGLVLARTEIDHIASLYLQDDVYCFTQVHHIGNKSIGMKSSLVKRNAEGALIEAAAAKGVLVAMDYAIGRSMQLPKKWRELIERFESQK